MSVLLQKKNLFKITKRWAGVLLLNFRNYDIIKGDQQLVARPVNKNGQVGLALDSQKVHQNFLIRLTWLFYLSATPARGSNRPSLFTFWAEISLATKWKSRGILWNPLAYLIQMGDKISQPERVPIGPPGRCEILSFLRLLCRYPYSRMGVLAHRWSARASQRQLCGLSSRRCKIFFLLKPRTPSPAIISSTPSQGIPSFPTQYDKSSPATYIATALRVRATTSLTKRWVSQANHEYLYSLKAAIRNFPIPTSYPTSRRVAHTSVIFRFHKVDRTPPKSFCALGYLVRPNELYRASEKLQD